MQQIKIFMSVENEVSQTEAEVNAWLRESGVRVLQIFGNIAPQTAPLGDPPGNSSGPLRFPPSDVILVVLYETA
ncbi:hypothetical protein LOC68_14930 [Blastopirellula sp. JC732]|uniref:Uncharacterized protein n=1 Tax=Blastopirellula sediminis TaxID=2894196 RepID=A0A9X1MNZ8_9BACT|nr:hypothetical protein [Blastopirellula sediminis]MCC9607022.1 hypothetical protein [Blastopirellula sediminis]MCC9629685.1 hypothetical protein [Blastopirellula sediminis]